MDVLVVVESCFGNTARVAEAVAEGLGGAPVQAAATAPTVLPAGLDLLLVGAPTHGGKLPTAGSRANAARRGTAGAKAYRAATGRTLEGEVERGLAEWLAQVQLPEGLRVLTFDTSLKGAAALLGTAAKSTARSLAKAGVAAERGPSFWVTPQDALLDGELTRARAWGAELAGTGAQG